MRELKHLVYFDNFIKINESISEEKTIDDYLSEVFLSDDYKELTNKLFDLISIEGWLVSIEEEFNEEYTKEDFEYIKLKLSESDKLGLINMDDDIVNKFSAFDLKLKEGQEHPYDTLDFIDYDKGIAYINHNHLELNRG